MSDPNQTNVRRYAGKAIISCAITGGIHTPTMSPYLPCTPAQIAAEAIAAAQAGASILHLHARNPELSDRFELVSETCAQPELTRNKVDATQRERRRG